jgi:subtilisin family serine protease
MAKLAKSAAIILALLVAAPAAAQLPSLPGGLGAPSLPNLPSPQLPSLGSVTRDLDRLTPRALADLRLTRLRDLVRANRQALDVDPLDNPIVRGELLATSPSAEGLKAAEAVGFKILRRESLPDVGVDLVALQALPRLSATQALKRLRKADPSGSYDYNHLYFGAGMPALAQAAPVAAQSGRTRIGLVDTGFDAAHPALSELTVEARGFAPGGYRPAAHGLAVASLLAGGAKGVIYSADVYGTGPTGGSAEAVVRALAWLSQSRVSVINVSLVGPHNRALETASKALVGRGVLIVAAVGNDGPAAPPAYPASYPGVLAVTGVDRRGKQLIEAGRALHVDFAAPGADIAAAQGRGWGSVRGTSFAAPIVAGRLAVLEEADADNPLEALARRATDIGPKGPDKTFGRGLVGGELFSR